MNKPHISTAFEKFQIIRLHLNQGVSLSKIAKINTLNVSTLKRWVKIYQSEGLDGLKRKERKDKGVRHNLTKEQQEIIEALILQKPPLSLAAIHRKYEKLAKEKDWTIPSYYIVRDIAGQISNDLFTLAHQGSKVYAQAFELLHRREADRSNEIWQADHTPLDLFVLDEFGVARKPWLTIIIDDYSRAISGYFLSFDAPSALNTALALRQAIWKKSNSKWEVCGIPEVLYTDHGSDFTSKHIEMVCADLKIRLVFSIVGKPRGRGKVERIFLSINQLLLMDLPGYAPEQSKPTKTNLTLADFSKLLEDFIVDQYHYRIHSTTKEKPFFRWKANAFLPQLPISLAKLDLLLLTVPKPRKVQRDGIYFNNFRYIDTNLAGYVRESVTIRYDPRDLAQISVFFKEQFICHAICQQLAGHTISLKEIIRARRCKKRELQQIINRRQVLLSEIFDQRSLKKSNKKTSTLKRYEND